MKPLRRFLDSLEPSFKEGKLRALYPLFEAADTFLYTPPDVTTGSTHVRDGMDLKRMMSVVVFALGPCILMAMYNTGYQANVALEQLASDGAITSPEAIGWRAGVMRGLGVGYNPNSLFACLIHGALYFIPIYLVTQIAGGFWEVLFAAVRKHEVNEGFFVTGMLFPLTLPPTIPLWQVALGISFGVVIGKEVFGGTGKNFLNPALTARAFLYFAYPADITGDGIWVAVDGFTAATPLGALANAGPEGTMAAVTSSVDGLNVTWQQAFLGLIPGSMGETSALCCLIGALILIATGVGSWRIMAAVLIGGLLSGLGFWGLGTLTDGGGALLFDNPMFQMGPLWHLVTGGFAFGLVFMATDPVSAAMTRTGKWVYGFLIGGLTIMIRTITGYPEGIMLAILLGNVFAPLIDYFVVQANINRRLKRSAA